MAHQLSDKEILTLLLLQQKVLAEEYNHTANHTDDPALLQTLTQINTEKQQNRLQIYQAMNQRGWYNPQPIDENQLNQAKQKFSQSRTKIQSITSSQPNRFGQQTPSQQPTFTQQQPWANQGSFQPRP